MKDILEEVFLHDAVRGSKAIGFITMGQGAPAQTIGYIVKDKTLGAVYAASACGPMPSCNLHTCEPSPNDYKPSMRAKKKPTRKQNIPRPRNAGQWTEARFTAFVKSALRGARWPARYECIKQAFVGMGVNPRTGRACKLHKCPDCGGLFPQNGMQADHIVAVIGPEGFQSWDLFISRLFCEADGFRALCKGCHKTITATERAERAALSKQSSGTEELF